MARKYINLPNRRGNLPFSDAVLVGETLYISGRIGIDPQTGYAPADVDQEIRLLLDGVREVLAAASMTMDDLVSVQSSARICRCSTASMRLTAVVSPASCRRARLSGQVRCCAMGTSS